MPLTRPRFDVWLQLPEDAPADTPPDHTVTIMSGDQLRAELEAHKLNLPRMKDAPLSATALWIWAALVRHHLIDTPAGAFMADPPHYEPATDVDVPPTRAASGLTGSDWPPPTVTPDSGSTPS